MSSPIAFVSRMNAETEAVWKQALRAAMPEEEILSFSELTDEQRRAVEFAIVANPDPADIAALPGLSWIHSLWAGVERLVLELGSKAPHRSAEGPGTFPRHGRSGAGMDLLSAA